MLYCLFSLLFVLMHFCLFFLLNHHMAHQYSDDLFSIFSYWMVPLILTYQGSECWEQCPYLYQERTELRLLAT